MKVNSKVAGDRPIADDPAIRHAAFTPKGGALSFAISTSHDDSKALS